MTVAIIDAPAYGSPEWVEWRRGGLGASDLPSVVGANPWQGEYALAAQKRGMTAPFEGNAATRWGHRMERVGIEVYQEATGLEVVTGETFGDDRYPHLWATLDGRIPDRNIGLEVKWTVRGWDELPRRIEVQALAQCGLAGLDAVDVVKLDPHGDPTISRVERDDDLIAAILGAGEAWFVRYVLGDEMPPYDRSPEAARALDRLAGPAEMAASEYQAQLMDQWQRIRRARDRLAEGEESLIRALKASMAGAGLLVGEGFRLPWTPVKGRTTTDWRAIAGELLPLVEPERVDALVAAHTKTNDDGLRFGPPKWMEETE